MADGPDIYGLLNPDDAQAQAAAQARLAALRGQKSIGMLGMVGGGPMAQVGQQMVTNADQGEVQLEKMPGTRLKYTMDAAAAKQAAKDRADMDAPETTDFFRQYGQTQAPDVDMSKLAPSVLRATIPMLEKSRKDELTYQGKKAEIERQNTKDAATERYQRAMVGIGYAGLDKSVVSTNPATGSRDIVNPRTKEVTPIDQGPPRGGTPGAPKDPAAALMKMGEALNDFRGRNGGDMIKNRARANAAGRILTLATDPQTGKVHDLSPKQYIELVKSTDSMLNNGGSSTVEGLHMLMQQTLTNSAAELIQHLTSHRADSGNLDLIEQLADTADREGLESLTQNHEAKKSIVPYLGPVMRALPEDAARTLAAAGLDPSDPIFEEGWGGKLPPAEKWQKSLVDPYRIVMPPNFHTRLAKKGLKDPSGGGGASAGAPPGMVTVKTPPTPEHPEGQVVHIRQANLAAAVAAGAVEVK